MPFQDNVGADFWGSKRLKAPEEYCLGATIDDRTNVFKAGALFFHLFGHFTHEQLAKIYHSNQFSPVDFENFSLPNTFYQLLLKAVHLEPEHRYQSIANFKQEWLFLQKN